MTTKLYVPSELLDKLHCSVCNGYLSVFPVHIKNDGDNPICGRCKIPNEDEYLRDEAFEGIAQFLIFPCSQSKNGCDQQLTPLKLKDHENCCTHRKLDCPSKNYSRCNWQGSNKDLKAHFEASHPQLVIADRKFEIQFLNSIKENLVMPFENELFIVKKEIDSRSGSFICSVEHVIQEEDPDSYNYFIRAESGNGTYYHKCPERSTSASAEEKTKFFADFIREQLHDPASIIAKIEIFKSNIIEDEAKVKVDVRSADVDWELLGELECPVCFDYMLPPIYQCISGHSICASCKPQVARCPICPGEIRNTQNYSLEKLTTRMMYPCKYHKMGCAITLKSSEIRSHEGSCEFGPYVCPLSEEETCTKKYNKSELISHVENNHPEYILKSDKINVPMGGGDQLIQKYYLIKFSNKLFKVCFKFENQQFYWALQLIGPAEECKNYKFEIDIVDNSENKLRQYTRGLCVPYSLQNEVFTKRRNYVSFLYDQIADFITDNLTYRVRVVKD